MLMPKLDVVVVTTAPPISPIGGWFLTLFRRAKLSYWVQDLHPDQLIALGRTSNDSIFARGMRWINRRATSRATSVVALDEFMANRLRDQYQLGEKLTVSRPWAHTEVLYPLAHDDNPERARRGWDEKRVLLYSGNLGFHTPIDALLEAVLQRRDDPNLILAIAGAGVGIERVREFAREHDLNNIEFYPFEPFDRMRYALSAADAHVVSMGSDVSGMIHPNKLYAAMALSRPVFMLSPKPCYADEIIEPNQIGWHHTHDDQQGILDSLDQFLSLPQDQLSEMGERGYELITTQYSKEVLVGRACDALAGVNQHTVDPAARQVESKEGVA